MRVEEAGAELRWYWRESAGELGLRSNFAPMVAMIESGGAQAVRQPHVDQRRMEAAERARKIARTLEAMANEDVAVLFWAYACKEVCGDHLGHVAIQLRECREAHRASRSKRSIADWYARLTAAAAAREEPDAERQRVWSKIRAAASRRLLEALDAYRRRAE